MEATRDVTDQPSDFPYLLLDSLKDPFVFVDVQHVIRYMNRAAESHYEGGRKLIGRSIFACHNEASCQQIHSVFSAMKAGLDESLITDSAEHRIFMRAVRDRGGNLLGYYERYEPPQKK